MSVKLFPARPARLIPWAAGAALLAAQWLAGTVGAQTTLPASPEPVAAQQGGETPRIPQNERPVVPTTPAPVTTLPAAPIEDVGCVGCGGGDPDHPCGGPCKPGQKTCGCCCNADTCVGKFFCGLYECICCPDPCYDPPHWCAIADAAFFVDAARPITQSRIRIDAGWNLKDPDRAEYFWAQEATNPKQVGATNCGQNTVQGKGPACIASRVDYESISLYQEAAIEKIGVFVEVPYEEIEPTTAGVNDRLAALNMTSPGMGCCNASGFGDVTVGTKTLILDCELLQMTFQFKTFIPSGSTGKGLGTGHVSLEPALLFGVNLAPDWFLQAETAYWIAVGGDPDYQGNIWHNHFSLNHVLWRPCCDFQLIGTAEINEWTVFQGSYTSDTAVVANNSPPPLYAPVALSASTTMASAGPGLRFVICDKMDLGIGSAFSFTGAHWAEELARVEFRYRY
jgi:hypothetical protein